MLKFHDTAQDTPRLRPAAERREDFAEIYGNYAREKAAEQASRCSQCGIPFCQVHCPVQNHIPDWLRLVAEGRLKEAFELSSSTNTFPEICGRICPQDRLCEGNCVVNKDFDAITIGSIEKFITETAFAEGWVTPFTPARENGRSVGIVGAGPAGLAAAEWLRSRGYAVHVYDRHDRIGGLLIYGIPNFKLDKTVIARRVEQYTDSGVVFHCATGIGTEVTLEELRTRHDAVLLATGVYQARELPMPGIGLSGIVAALDYLIASNRTGLGDTADPATSLHAAGKRVIVIGGGDTAMDCVRTAIRQGAASVTCLYRRDRENMPGSRREVRYAEEEGVTFEWLSIPRGFAGDKSVTAVHAQRMRMGPADAGGRRAPEPITDSDFTLPADLVITALGFEAETLPSLFGEPTLLAHDDGRIKIDATYRTSLPNVYAAGDIVRGASLVVWAIRDGRDAGAAIDAALSTVIPSHDGVYPAIHAEAALDPATGAG